MLKFLLPDDAKVNITIVDIRQRSNLTTNKTIRFTEKSFFYTVSAFTQSHSGVLGDIENFIQLIPGWHKSGKPINNTSVDKVHSKCDCINGSIVNGVKEPIVYSSALDKPPGHKIYKEPRIKFFKRMNKSVLSRFTFYFEGGDHKLVDSNGESICFTCQLLKIKT